MLEAVIEHFEYIRKNKGMRKKTATAELLAWIHVLDKLDIDIRHRDRADVKAQLKKSYSILAKNADDFKRIMK